MAAGDSSFSSLSSGPTRFLVDQPILIEVDEVASFDFAVADTGAEDKRMICRRAGSQLAGVVEVLNYPADCAEQRPQLCAALIGRVDNGAAEDDVLGKESQQRVKVSALNRIAELLHGITSI